MHNPEQEQSKTKSEKIKETYKSSEEYINEKLTIRSMLLMIIVPVLIKVLEAVSLIVFVVPFQEQLTVYTNLSFLMILFFVLLIGLYGFNEWKIRLELKSKTTVKTVKLSDQLRQAEYRLINTIDDKAKETMMSNAVVVTGIIQTQEERQELAEELEKIDYRPNGVDIMDIDRAKKFINDLSEEITKQEQKNLNEIEQEIQQDLEQDPVVDELTDEINKIIGPIKFSKIEAINLAPVMDPPVVIKEPDLEVHVDGKGNKYTLNEDGTRNYN